MIRNLYLNEELIISMNKDNKLNGVIKREFLAKKVDPINLHFVKENPDIMEKLREGQELQITTNGIIVKSSIDDLTGKGYSIPTSVENLEEKLNARRF